VTVYFAHPENVFFLVNTRDNTTGKDNDNQGGQKKVVPRGEIPKELLGVKDSHYTITPIDDATGVLRFVMEYLQDRSFPRSGLLALTFCRMGQQQ
jgi:hypothetical protein